MKLIKSITEEQYRQQLSNSWTAIKLNARLMQLLTNRLGLVTTAFVLSWTPEQSEEFYTILVNGASVVRLEISRDGDECISFKVDPVDAYGRMQKYKQKRIQLAVALDLARKSEGN